MKVTLKNKKKLNSEFSLEGLIVLDYDQLLHVNGAGGSSGSSGGSSSGPSSSSSSSSSGNLTDRGYPSSTEGYQPSSSSGKGSTQSSPSSSPTSSKSSDSSASTTVDANQSSAPTSASFGKINNKYKKTMQQYVGKQDSEGNDIDSQKNGNKEFSKVGCVMTADSMIASTIAGKEISLLDINNNYDANKDGLMSREESNKAIKSSTNKDVSCDWWESQLSKEKLDEIAKSDAEKGTTTYIVARAVDVYHGEAHQIVVEGYHINDKGQVEFDYTGTSNNDTGRTYILGTPAADQSNTFKVDKIETYTVKNYKSITIIFFLRLWLLI